MLSIPIRTIKRKFHITAANPSIAASLAFMKTDPEIEGEEPEHIELPVVINRGFLSLRPPSGAVIEGSASQVLSELHHLHLLSVIHECPNAALIHCTTVTINNEHVIFLDEESAGCSTLLLYLAANGWPVACDGHLIFNGANSIPCPRSLRVRKRMLTHLPKHAVDVICASPFIIDWNGSMTFAVEPSAFGSRWVLKARPVRNIILLRSNDGGRSRLRQLDWQTAFEKLLKCTFLPEADRIRILAALRTMVMSANCLELWNGSDEDSHRLLDKIFDVGVQ